MLYRGESPMGKPSQVVSSKFRKALEGKLEILSFHLRSPVGKGKMTIPQVQGSPAMELVELIKRRSVSGLNVVGGERA